MDRSDFYPTSVEETVGQIIAQGPTECSVNVVDLDQIVQNYQRWVERHAGFEAYYAPSVNNQPMVLALMAKLGAGFSCASEEEMCTALSLGVRPDRIRLVHPVKTVESIVFAQRNSIRRIVCDSAVEISKVYGLYPEAQIVLRVRMCREQKYGCCPRDAVTDIFNHAKLMGVQMAGIYVAIPPANQLQVDALQRGLQEAKAVYEQAYAMGLRHIDELALFGVESLAPSVLRNATAALNFPPGFTFIIETERQFVGNAVSLVANVQSKRVVRDTEAPELIREIMYFINDGRYGSFEWWRPVTKEPTVYRGTHAATLPAQTWPSSVWGPTCDSADIVFERIHLPELDIGDFMVFSDVGAYGGTLASQFNGFPLPKTVVCAQHAATRAFLGLQPQCS
ncbi:antizyme inhibitor 2-like [Anopheles cruzii]|uniref:antizyme inhibitor 2-like n=1 Tax=Anopheles cruzii TaxID=68878 RepID=UPI0022EC6547|nr:antizyme inhibitor 2-like [Anopheles cruzii]